LIRIRSGMRWRAAVQIAVAPCRNRRRQHRDRVAALLVEPDRAPTESRARTSRRRRPCRDKSCRSRSARYRTASRAEGAEAHLVGIVELGAQRRGDLLHGDHAAVGAARFGGLARLPGRLGAALLPSASTNSATTASPWSPSRRPRSAAPGIPCWRGVQVLIERGADHLGADLADIAGLAQRAAQIIQSSARMTSASHTSSRAGLGAR